MGRPFKFGRRTKTTSFRIPKDLIEDEDEYERLRGILTESIERYYEEFRERQKFKKRVKCYIQRGFRSFSEFTNKKPIKGNQ